MTEQLHPQRESYPLITADDELVMVFRDHLVSTRTPQFFVKALGPVEFRIDESQTLDDRAGYVVVDFSNGAGDDLTITVDGGTPTTLTEGVDFDAEISNTQTAINIAEAINGASLGLVASFETNEPNVFIVPEANSGIKTFSLASGDKTAWTPDSLAVPGSIVTLGTGHSDVLTLGSRSPLDKVAFLKILSGRLSADLRSPIEVRTYFRQPETLRATTGQPGGWPTAP